MFSLQICRYSLGKKWLRSSKVVEKFIKGPLRKTTAPKFILAILIFFCQVHFKIKKSQTNSELQALISELQNFVKVLKWSLFLFCRFEEYIAWQLMFDDKIENRIY